MTADTAPGQVFLTASFGLGPWRPPRDLAEHAAQRFRMAEALVRANWTCEGGEPVLARFEVEIRADGGERNFRSDNFGPDAASLDFAWGSLTLPRHGEEMLSFNVSVLLPERRNRGEPVGADRVEVTMTGVAVPIPRWVNY